MQTESDARPGAALRAGLATAAAAAITTLLLLALRTMLAASLPEGPTWAPGSALGLRVDTLVGLGVVTVGVAAAATLTVGCLLLVAATVAPGRWAVRLTRLARPLTPAVLRRTVAVGVGAGLGLLGPVGMAGATEIDLGWAVTTPAADGTGAQQSPGAASTAAEHSPAAPSTAAVVTPISLPPSAPIASVVVVPGDSLWSIAAAHLPPGASDAEIAAAWPCWYAANRVLIGGDPDLVMPGQVLVAPVATAAQVTS